MSEIHGRLLIGGMTLNDLFGVVELTDECGCSPWCGHLLIDPVYNEHLEMGRVYRLEMDDGRSGQIVVNRVECTIGQRTLRVEFSGVKALDPPRFSPPVDSLRAPCESVLSLESGA